MANIFGFIFFTDDIQIARHGKYDIICAKEQPCGKRHSNLDNFFLPAIFDIANLIHVHRLGNMMKQDNGGDAGYSCKHGRREPSHGCQRFFAKGGKPEAKYHYIW